MHIDASAIVAILKNEPERREFIERIDAEPECSTSVVSAFEASLAVAALTGSCSSAASEVVRFIEQAGIDMAPLDGRVLLEMAIARDQYGKGTGHPAQLNLGDCISYAVAKSLNQRLLYKGNDFAQTDLA